MGLAMTQTRSDILRQLADAKPDDTTTISSLSASCEVDEAALRSHLQALADCDLARIYPDGRTRVTITGEELLALDAADPVIVDADGGGFIGSRTQSAPDMEGDSG
jgi:DNA-binding transcriptional ArsR family regulator